MKSFEDQSIYVGKALKDYFKEKKFSQQEVAKRVGISQAAVSQYYKGLPFGKNAANKWAEVFGINASWLITGKGQMLNDEEGAAGAQTPPGASIIPVVPTEASAGHLCDFADSVQDYSCEMMISPVKDATLAMAVYGDSMFPEYPSGSRVLLKKINEKAFIEWGKVYVLDTENGAVIKEIHHCEDENYIECVSQNPDPKYQPFKVPKSSIFGWYKVIMVLSYK